MRPTRWSIRTRTAVAFGTLSLVLATALLVFVTIMAQRGVATVFDLATGEEVPARATALPGTDTSPVAPGDTATRGPDVVRSSPEAQPPEVPPVSSVSGVLAGQQWTWSVVGVGMAAVVAAAAGALVARAVLRPVDAIRATAERISASTLHERIALDGPDDELRRLADTIDALVARLEQAFAAQRRFVAQASHELRTPLAVQRAAIQIGLEDDATPEHIRAVRAELLEANRRTEQLVSGLLALAEADRGIDRRDPVEVDAVATSAVAAIGAAASARSVDVRCTVTGPWRPTGDAVLVRHLVDNLLENAVEYNVAGGRVLVRVDAEGLTVENTGPEVPEARVPDLLEPFTRLEPDRAADRHSGIGLSVVAAVARAHGWRLALRSRPGGGLVVRVDGGPTAVVPSADGDAPDRVPPV